jgi:hypothetical protein
MSSSGKPVPIFLNDAELFEQFKEWKKDQCRVWSREVLDQAMIIYLIETFPGVQINDAENN